MIIVLDVIHSNTILDVIHIILYYIMLYYVMSLCHWRSLPPCPDSAAGQLTRIAATAGMVTVNQGESLV